MPQPQLMPCSRRSGTDASMSRSKCHHCLILQPGALLGLTQLDPPPPSSAGPLWTLGSEARRDLCSTGLG